MQTESEWIDDLQTLGEAMFGGCGTYRHPDCARLSDAALERRMKEVFGVSGGVRVEARDGWIAVECEAGFEPTWQELERTALSIPGVRGLTSRRGPGCPMVERQTKLRRHGFRPTHSVAH